MGQRSAIYIRYNKKLIVANYYQWNYAERMISRARYTLDFCNYYLAEGITSYFESKYEVEKIRTYCDINFDMKDVARNSNMIKEWEDYKDTNFNDFIFGSDNNDGRLFIDIETEGKSFTNEFKYKIKYCFTDWNCEKIFDGIGYMNWDIENFKEYRANYLDAEDNQALDNNLVAIGKYQLMTKEELKNFLNTDYTPKNEK